MTYFITQQQKEHKKLLHTVETTMGILFLSSGYKSTDHIKILLPIMR